MMSNKKHSSQSSNSKHSSNQKHSLVFSEIQSIVDGFNRLLIEKWRGSKDDYPKIILSTLILKRILDINEEKASSVALTWDALMDYEDNQDGSPRTLGIGTDPDRRGQYKTFARSFVELMFEIIEGLDERIRFVFETFEYRKLLTQNALPLDEFRKACRSYLSPKKFDSLLGGDVLGDVYMDLVGKLAGDSGKKGGEFFTPAELVKDAWRFLDLDAYATGLGNDDIEAISIGDPTAGSNTFLTAGYDLIKERCNAIGAAANGSAFRFFGQELKSFQYGLGLANMFFHGLLDQYNPGISTESQNSNVITNYASGIGSMRGQLDIVVANPPYGTKDYGIDYATEHTDSDERWKFGVPTKQEGEMAFLMTIYDLMAKQGKALVIMPLGTLFRDTGRAFRKALLEEDVIEGLVSLPGNMFLTTAIPVVLWILNKSKKESDQGKVFMVNASKDFMKLGRFNEWRSEKAIQSYLSRTMEDGYSGYVGLDQLTNNKFNLSVNRYFSDEPKKEKIDIIQLNDEIEQLEESLRVQKEKMRPMWQQIIEIEKAKRSKANPAAFD